MTLKCLLPLCLLWLFAARTDAQTAPDSLVARLQSLNRDVWTPFAESFGAGDAERFNSLHSPDFIRASGGIQGSISGLDQYAESNRRGFRRRKDAGMKTGIRFAFTERLAGAEFASERGIFHFRRENPDGKVTEGYGRFHVVSRLENGRWKILFDYDSDEGGTIGRDDFEAGFAPDDWTVLLRPAFALEAVLAHIETANAAYSQRFQTADSAWYAARYTTDACILPAGTPSVCGREPIIAYYYDEGRNRGLNLRITTTGIGGGPDAVVEEGRYELADAQGKSLDKGKFIAIWAPEGGIWKLRREIWTTDGKE